MKGTQIFSRLAAGASLAAVLAGAAPSYAYRMEQSSTSGRITGSARVTCNDAGGFAHWLYPTTTWFHNTAGQGAGKEAALRNAMASWTNVASASHVMSYAGTTTAGFATDRQNSIVWAVGNGCGMNCLALTALVLRQPDQVILESDITFNENFTWRTNGLDNDTEGVAAHELGHALGIHHTELTTMPLPTMTAQYFGTGERSLENDDIAALQCSQNRYPPSLTPASLTVTNAACYGLNDLTWDGAGPTVVRYELYGSTSSTFTNQWLEYSGLDLEHTVDVTGTVYYRVRACDISTCSSYRTGNRAARYVNGCF